MIQIGDKDANKRICNNVRPRRHKALQDARQWLDSRGNQTYHERNDVMKPDFEKTFAAISGHFLTQQLPDNWNDFEDEYLEEWFVECAIHTYEFLDWDKVYAKIERITKTVMELYKDA
jgi:hypothetical protein